MQTGFTPHLNLCSENPQWQYRYHLKIQNTHQSKKKLTTFLQNREEALAAHELAGSHIADRRKSTFTPFKRGDQVWLDSRNLKTTYMYHKKMKPKREGPFTITEVLGPVTYRLDLPKTWRIHNVFNAILLRRYKENEVYGQNFTKPPPELLEGEEVYEVETILNHRIRGRGYQYYVKWRGYPISDASWVGNGTGQPRGVGKLTRTLARKDRVLDLTG